MSKYQIFELTNKRIYLLVAQSKVAAGFPTLVTKYNEERLDINIDYKSSNG